MSLSPPILGTNDRRTWSRQSETGIVDDWIKKGFTFVPFSPPAGLVDSVIRGYREFFETKSHEEMTRWSFGHPSDPETGFLSRVDRDGNPLPSEYANNGKVNDNKYLFHYRTSLISLLDTNQVYYKDELSWLESCHKLFKYCRDRGRACQELIDGDSELRLGGGHVERYENPVAEEEHTLRLIYYRNAVAPNAKLCNGHIDRCWSTFQVNETDPALKVVTRDREVIDYVPVPGKALFFPGQKAPYATNNAVEGTYHYCQVPEGYVPDTEVKYRFAIIFFGHEAAPHIPRLREYADGTRTEAELQKFREDKIAKKKLRTDTEKHKLAVAGK